MSSNPEEDTAPGVKARAEQVNAWADPKVDSILGRAMKSPRTTVILLVSHGIAFGLGVWAAW